MARVAPVPVGRVEEERKRIILDAAAECTTEDGVDALTLRKVARRAGVSIGMISYYFPTKNDLLIATLQKTADRISEGASSAAGSRGPSVEGVRKALEIALQPGELGGNWPFRLAFAAKAAHEPELASFYAQRLQAIKGNMARAVSNSMVSGQVNGNFDATLCADLLLCLQQGLGMETTVDPGHMTTERALEIFDFVLYLMGHSQPSED